MKISDKRRGTGKKIYTAVCQNVKGIIYLKERNDILGRNDI